MMILIIPYPPHYIIYHLPKLNHYYGYCIVISKDITCRKGQDKYAKKLAIKISSVKHQWSLSMTGMPVNKKLVLKKSKREYTVHVGIIPT